MGCFYDTMRLSYKMTGTRTVIFESVSVRYQMVPLPEQAHSVHKWRMLSITHPTSSIPVCVETSPDDAYTLRMEP